VGELVAAFLAGAIGSLLGYWATTTQLLPEPSPKRMERARRQLQWLNDNVWGPLWLWRHRNHAVQVSPGYGEGWSWWECGYPCHGSHVRTYGTTGREESAE
jgi:hypothetical protein